MKVKQFSFRFQNQYPIAPEGQVQKIQLEILDDNDPEPDELVLVYLSDVLGGARVAADSETPLQVINASHLVFNSLLLCGK